MISVLNCTEHIASVSILKISVITLLSDFDHSVSAHSGVIECALSSVDCHHIAVQASQTDCGALASGAVPPTWQTAALTRVESERALDWRGHSHLTEPECVEVISRQTHAGSELRIVHSPTHTCRAQSTYQNGSVPAGRAYTDARNWISGESTSAGTD